MIYCFNFLTLIPLNLVKFRVTNSERFEKEMSSRYQVQGVWPRSNAGYAVPTTLSGHYRRIIIILLSDALVPRRVSETARAVRAKEG